jgi:hypothetical protein
MHAQLETAGLQLALPWVTQAIYLRPLEEVNLWCDGVI